MSDSNSKNELQYALNKHGYNFQFAVIGLAERLFENFRDSQWANPIAEFPVEVGGQSTRIDILLEHYSLPMLMIAECKRVNPKYSKWLFVKNPFAGIHPLSHRIFAECVEWLDEKAKPLCKIKGFHRSHNIYHIGVEVTTNEKGDPNDKGRGGIEDAAKQVLCGLNGLIESLHARDKSPNRLNEVTLIPVIFTTAELWVSDVGLSKADINTGKLDLDEGSFKQTNMIWYHYNQSPGLRHKFNTFEPEGVESSMINALYTDYVRTIAVVSAPGIPDFLQQEHFKT